MVSMLSRLHFTSLLKLASDLHIGTGERQKRSEFLAIAPPNDENAADPLVALTARNVEKKSIIPATALKSALRRAYGTMDAPSTERLFGVVKNDGQGRIGSLWLETAVWKTAPSDCGELPHWNKGDGNTYIASHVALERATRTAADQKLYMVERVPAGTTFELSGDLFGPEAETDLEKIAAILARGIAVGADERHGAGRIVLEGPMSYSLHAFDCTTGSCTTKANQTLAIKGSPQASEPSIAPFEITLACRGPYVSLDSTREKGNKRGAARRSEHTPTLAPASLLGALRSRCAWLSHSVPGLAVGARGDNPFRAAVKRDGIGRLTCTERLFGANGWRGLLHIAKLDIGGTLAARTYTSVALDRFTQGPLDEALFETEYFHDCKLTFSLNIEKRFSFPNGDDDKLFQALRKDVEKNGLMLGHGSNKGFGWFLPEVAAPRALAEVAHLTSSAPPVSSRKWKPPRPR